jgi:hypothetical protein
MVFLNDQNSNAYLESTDLMLVLEPAVAEMLKACYTDGSTKDPLNFLGEWLMRNNPRRNPEARERLEALRVAREAGTATGSAASDDVHEEGDESVRGALHKKLTMGLIISPDELALLANGSAELSGPSATLSASQGDHDDGQGNELTPNDVRKLLQQGKMVSPQHLKLIDECGE